jgi:hypothetical protein
MMCTELRPPQREGSRSRIATHVALHEAEREREEERRMIWQLRMVMMTMNVGRLGCHCNQPALGLHASRTARRLHIPC